MDPTQHTAFVRILGQALGRPPEDRTAFLQEACGDDETLHRLLESVLADMPSDAFLTTSKMGVIYSNDFDLIVNGVPVAVGPYALIRELGRGGMGAVYLGERRDGEFEHQVAIKLARFATVDRKRLLRFKAERSILARMNHPNIARLYDGGVTERGVPYLAMEYVDGRPIDRYCAEERLSLEARLRLFMEACRAVQYAHQNFVVHRDLKPSNILVTADGTPKLLDFGIAKLLEADEEFAELTHTGGAAMTPAYAAPEQIRGGQITTATDVYTLGVLLYTLLTGTQPYTFPSQRPQDIERVVCEVMPTMPSKAARATATPERDPKETGIPFPARVLQGELDNIVMMALRKAPEERYASAAALSADIERFLENKPVHAHPPGRFYRAKKFAIRNTKGLAVVILLVGSLGIAALQSYNAWKERKEFEIQFDASLEWLNTLDPLATDESEVPTSVLLSQLSSQAHERFQDNPSELARYLSQIGRVYTSQGLYLEAIRLHEEASAIFTNANIRKPEILAQLMYDQAKSYHSAGRIADAYTLHSKAFQIRSTFLPKESREYIESLLDIAYIELERNNSASAMHKCYEAAKLSASAFGNSHHLTLRSHLYISIAYSIDQEYEKSENILRTIIKTLDHEGYANHVRTADHLNTLSTLLIDRFRISLDTTLIEEATSVSDRSIHIARQRLRTGHPILANNLNTRGVLLSELGRYSEALVFLRESLSIYSKHIDPQHPSIAQVLSNIAYAESRLGNMDLANMLYTESYTRASRTLGANHPKTAFNLLQLSFILEDTEPKEALDRASQALTIYRTVLDPGHPDTQRALMQLAKLEMKRGHGEAAEPLVREVLGYRVSNLPEGNWRIGSAQSFLGESLMQQHRLDEAEPLLLQGYETLRATRGEHDEKTVAARDRLRRFRELRQSFADASP